MSELSHSIKSDVTIVKSRDNASWKESYWYGVIIMSESSHFIKYSINDSTMTHTGDDVEVVPTGDVVPRMSSSLPS